MNRRNLVGMIWLAAAPVFGQYSTHIEGDVVRLEDGARQTKVSVMPSRGNNAFETPPLEVPRTRPCVVSIETSAGGAPGRMLRNGPTPIETDPVKKVLRKQAEGFQC